MNVMRVIIKECINLDGVVKTSIYYVACPGAIRGHTTCIVVTHPATPRSLRSAALTCIPVFLLSHL